jgi:putative ABC transport system ATP-binding protein
MLELTNITKRYTKGQDTFTALENVSLKINAGDYLSVTGPSGAGKSTLLYIIGGLIRPDSGSITFRGKSIYDQTMKEKDLYRKKKIGFVFQQFHLMPFLTVKENIKLACHQKDYSEKIIHYLDKCSLTDLRNKYPSELSVGEKQRTAFIRAIISNPEILLADEPTGNLDTDNSIILMDLIDAYHKSGGTVIIVSHNPETAKYAGSVTRLEKGRIINLN